VIISLAQDKIRVAAEVAAHEQAWVGANGVLGVPVRLDGEAGYTRHWDLTAVNDVLDRAVALQWQARELTAWLRGDVAHHVAILRPDHDQDSAEVDVVSSAGLDELLAAAEQAGGLVVPVAVAARVAWEVDATDGTVVYRGCDVELAWEMAHLYPPDDVHLLPAGPAVLSGGGR
jgi:hypothetical protein